MLPPPPPLLKKLALWTLFLSICLDDYMELHLSSKLCLVHV